MELKPGYRFNPTDVELLDHYLKYKMLGNGPAVQKGINEVCFYQHEPWDLHYHAKMPSRHGVWHFFTQLDYKSEKKGSTVKRATKAGYWKVTGRDRKVKYKGEIIGSKKTVVFYKGRWPKGEKTDWTMHEYHHASIPLHQKPYVVCKVMEKKRQTRTVQPSEDGSEALNLNFEIVSQNQPSAESSIGYGADNSMSESRTDIMQLHGISLDECWNGIYWDIPFEEVMPEIQTMYPELMENLFADKDRLFSSNDLCHNSRIPKGLNPVS